MAVSRTQTHGELRPGEITVDPPPPTDAGLVFIGRIHTPWNERGEAPRRGSLDGPVCRIEVFEPWVRALDGLERAERIEVIYWLHLSRRDLVVQNRGHAGILHGTFAIRSPVRPNPLGTSIVRLLGIENGSLMVRGMDCLDGTPLLDLKPERLAIPPTPQPL